MSSSLRPAWANKSKGFQPPPTVASERSRSQSGGSQDLDSKKSNTNKFAALDSSDDEDPHTRRSNVSRRGRSLADLARTEPTTQQRKVSTTAAPQIRFTRERLLSLRPTPGTERPANLILESGVISEVAQDPVCWDAAIDPEELWAAAPPRRKASMDESAPSGGLPVRRAPTARTSSRGVGEGRWQRGVALPPEGANPKKEKAVHSNNPDDLWDDPMQAAATDFSAFGAMPEETDDDVFDFDKMAQASKELEDEMRGRKSKPLATPGTTIRSGSGDDVNVFEDVDDPVAPIKAVDEDPTASSRLMAMIGVRKDEGAAPTAWDGGDSKPEAKPSEKNSSSSVAGIPLNPWGDPIVSGGGGSTSEQQQNLQARLRGAEQKAEEEQQMRLQQEEAQRRDQERAFQKQQQDGVQSQVEGVLMERISMVLENSWGSADLATVLTTLHNEDARVVPLLNSVDALRALLLRNPRRVAIRQDPSLRIETASLLMTNAQYRQREQQEQQRAQQHNAMRQEEMQRQREQQRRMEEQAVHRVDPNAPWYYSDPSKNIQGPFRGEEMRQWLEAGYFKGDLPICQNPQGPFRPLSQIFTDLNQAFAVLTPSAQEIAAKMAEEKAASAREAKREAAEQSMREKRERAEKSSNGAGNESSAQLKMMLGLGSHASAATVTPESANQEGVLADKKSPQKSTPQPVESKEPALSSIEAAPSKSAAPAWGGAASSQPMQRKSMSEIQKEEARAAAVVAMSRQGGRSSSSGWANVAAAKGGSTAWQGGTAKQSPASVLPSSAGRLGRSVSMQAKSSMGQSKQAPQRTTSVSGVDAAEAFGATMAPALEKWCKDQMNKLNGTDDLTLVSFCMTLAEPDEIRQYLAAYLGSSPQVTNFATEFINRKGGNKDKQDEWESTVTAKKNRKKKAPR